MYYEPSPSFLFPFHQKAEKSEKDPLPKRRAKVFYFQFEKNFFLLLSLLGSAVVFISKGE
jgi:hypothetical protein